MAKIMIRSVTVSECYTNCYICMNKDTKEGFIVEMCIRDRLGRDALSKSVQAGMIAFVIIVLFLLFVYRVPGLSLIHIWML